MDFEGFVQIRIFNVVLCLLDIILHSSAWEFAKTNL